MTDQTTIYACSNCGAQYLKWQGRCSECGAWGTLEQESITRSASWRMAEQKHKNTDALADTPLDLEQITITSQSRIKTNIEELDRVLGGGIVLGSLILLGGDPGIGKSTLALQIAGQISNALYVSGEESAQQIKIRAERISLNISQFKFLLQTDINKIIATAEKEKPSLIIIDSIQTMRLIDNTTSQGTATQLIASTSQLLAFAKESGASVIIIGHVTKEGYVAGPKTLEHLVDTVLYLENDSDNYYKILRSVKNRFGSTGEIGIFEMTASGLKEVANPTEIFFQQKQGEVKSGTITTIVMEGQRPFVVEVQALVAKSAFGYPQRRATGFDLNRLQMLIAVISKAAKLNLSSQDVYLNVAGGLKIKETAIDLAVCLAVVSAFLDLPFGLKTVALGEVGLNGEVRHIPKIDKRIKEAKKLNFNQIIAPRAPNLNSAQNIILVGALAEAIRILNQK